MDIVKGVVKVGLSPLNGVKQLAQDLMGETTEEEQGLAILTLGASSIGKGIAKGLISGISDIFD